jgi:hypothetical protein
MSQLFFVDTEFTGFKDPKLISIGVVAQTGEEFYAEVEHAVDECSDFVRATVLPLLNQNKIYSLAELKDALSSWIDTVRQDGPILICYDSEYDRTMLSQIFENDTPNGIVFRNLGASYVNKLKMYEWHVKNKQPEHHALHDARALKYAFRGWVRKVR